MVTSSHRRHGTVRHHPEIGRRHRETGHRHRETGHLR
jgi:hypothetical protein